MASKLKHINLHHPQNKCPATAVQIGYYFQNGKQVGLKLQFPDGLVAELTHQEIRDLQQRDDESPN